MDPTRRSEIEAMIQQREPLVGVTKEELDDVQRHWRIKVNAAVYKAACILEELEFAGLISGNGHHKAQRVGDFASQLFDAAWRPKLVEPAAAGAAVDTAPVIS